MTSIPSIDGYDSNDREALSALFDGELDADAARFALKRLGHDAQWRRACGSWQLCGDALRGQAAGIAAPDFADRVAAAIAAEAATAQAVAPVSAPGNRRGWIGGAALAASVAVAALFVVRPFSNEAAPDAAAPQTQVASADPAPAAPQAPGQQAPDQQAAGLAAAVAVAEVPRRIADRRNSRGQSQRAALRAPRRQTQAVAAVAAVAAPAAEVATANAGSASANPFRPQHNETATRPWPRAVLPNYPATGGFTASYGSSSASARSFYPFEPATAEAAPSAPTTPSPDAEGRMPQP